MEEAWVNASYGGLLIGLSAAIFLVLEGRVLGVSGITGRLLETTRGDSAWRVIFVLGVVFGGWIGAQFWPQNFVNLLGATDGFRLTVAGLLVGFGTKMSNGCTSGHGVCGIGRLSPRSIFATITFMIFGALTVFVSGR